MNLTWAPDSSRFAFTKDNDLYVCAKASSDTTVIPTTLSPGSIAIVKIGEKAIKVLMK